MKSSKKHFKSFTIIILSAIIVCINVIALPSFAADNDENIYDKINSYLSDIVPKSHFPSFSVTIVDKENVLFSKTYGDYGSPDTPYLLGSTSKSFTALCIMQLVEQRKINLNGYLSDYIPNAADGDKITIIQLLNHTSGLGEHQNLENYKIVNEQGVHLYANVNYSLLGKIIEAVSGKTYEKYITENIFDPLNMNATFSNPQKAENNGLIDGYENWFGFNIKTRCKYQDSENAWITAPAGYISSSTEDLGRYLQMYLNGGENIISAESINEMFFNNVAVNGDIPYKYGMGWNLINEPLKYPALRHSGLVETGMSCIYILPESGIGIAMTINSNDYFVGRDFADKIGWGIVLMLMGDEPNQINSNEYALMHLMYDAVYISVIIISALPIFLIGKYKIRISNGKIATKIGLLLILHLLLPVFILMLSKIFFDTPLWVVRAFVPDMFFAVIVSSCLLFLGGIIKGYLIIHNEILVSYRSHWTRYDIMRHY